jgi:prefoldin subunit 5
MDIDARAFGYLEGEVKAIVKTLEEQNKTLAALTKELGEIKTTLSEAKGGWKTLVWIGGASATAAGCVTWIMQHLKLMP